MSQFHVFGDQPQLCVRLAMWILVSTAGSVETSTSLSVSKSASASSHGPFTLAAVMSLNCSAKPPVAGASAARDKVDSLDIDIPDSIRQDVAEMPLGDTPLVAMLRLKLKLRVQDELPLAKAIRPTDRNRDMCICRQR